MVALALAACVAPSDEPVDLGTLGDDKSDTALPRRVEVSIAPGERQRFRITTRAFVASLTQAGAVPAQLVAKHYEHVHESATATGPVVTATADDTVRHWTLTVHNRGDDTLDASVIVTLPRAGELGIVSDIDKTVLPPATAAGLPPPYPGIATLLEILELRAGGTAGDLHYVTARTPEGVAEIPAWMAEHGVPAGPIETGISGVPWVAQAEKIADITRIFESRPDQRFVLFGDSSHRDPEVYQAIRATFPDRVVAVFIHKVNVTVSPDRVAGLHLVTSYAEATALAFGADLVSEPEARAIIEAARAEGLALTDEEVEALLDAQR